MDTVKYASCNSTKTRRLWPRIGAVWETRLPYLVDDAAYLLLQNKIRRSRRGAYWSRFVAQSVKHLATSRFLRPSLVPGSGREANFCVCLRPRLAICRHMMKALKFVRPRVPAPWAGAGRGGMRHWVNRNSGWPGQLPWSKRCGTTGICCAGRIAALPTILSLL
jgi:hypothetical protein